MVATHKFSAWLASIRYKGKGGLNDYWRWIGHAIMHGVIIGFFVMESCDGAYEADDSNEFIIWKSIGQKDCSTVAFNIVLHTIFLKLLFELEKMARPAVLVIVITIVVSYVIIALFGFSDIALLLDKDLIGVGARSVMSLPSFLLLFGTCTAILFIEYAIMSLRHIRRIIPSKDPA